MCSSFVGTVVQEQSAPIKNDCPAIWAMVIDDVKSSYTLHPAQKVALKDMQDRDDLGMQRYGTRLQPFNGRNALIDALQEFYDGAVYLKQQLYELQQDRNNGKTGPISDRFVPLEAMYWKHLDNLLNLRQYCTMVGIIK